MGAFRPCPSEVLWIVKVIPLFGTGGLVLNSINKFEASCTGFAGHVGRTGVDRHLDTMWIGVWCHRIQYGVGYFGSVNGCATYFFCPTEPNLHELARSEQSQMFSDVISLGKVGKMQGFQYTWPCSEETAFRGKVSVRARLL